MIEGGYVERLLNCHKNDRKAMHYKQQCSRINGQNEHQWFLELTCDFHWIEYQRVASKKIFFTFIPSSQEIQRSPLVRKQATACLAKWCIQPSSLSWVMIASIHGNPVWPYPINFFLWKLKQEKEKKETTDEFSLTFAHLASASTFLSQGICTQIGLPCIRSKFGFFVAAQ